MRHIIYVVVLWFATYTIAIAIAIAIAANSHLQYHFDYQKKTITLEFTGNQSGITNLILPNEQYGNKELSSNLTNFQVVGAKLSPTQYQFIKVLTHTPGANIKVSYNFSISNLELPTNLNQARKPLLQTSYFHFIGATLFIVPELEQSKNLTCTMNWSLPDKWTFASSFGINDHTQQHKGSIENMLNGLFIGGDFRLNIKKIKGKDIYIAIRGTWPFTDNALELNLVNIISLERDFWHDHKTPYFLISAIPIHKQENIISGLGLTNAFSLFIAEKQTLNANLQRLLVHEYFHSWNNPRLFTTHYNEQIQYLWFTEGFTDYYTDLLALRGGFITLEEYLQNYNKTLFEYYSSSALNIANAAIQSNFWNNYDVNKIPYQRGYILAHNWNANIKLNHRPNWTKSLDDAMQDIITMHQTLLSAQQKQSPMKDAKTSPANIATYHEKYVALEDIAKQSSLSLIGCAKHNLAISEQHPLKDVQNIETQNFSTTLTINNIAAIINKYTTQDIYPDIEKYILQGNTLLPNSQPLGKCIKYNLVNMKVLEPGFDLRTSAMLGIITNVKNNSSAYQAGLRNNQKIINIEYNLMDSNSPIVIKILATSGYKTIQFYRNKETTIAVPQFSLDHAMVAETPELCLQWFGKIQSHLY